MVIFQFYCKEAVLEPGKQVSRSTGKGILIALLCSFFFSWQSPITKLLMREHVSSIDCVTMLFLFGAVLVNLITLASPRRKEVYRDCIRCSKALVPMALMNFFVSVGIFYALRTLSAGVVSVLLYMSPAYVCIFFMITKIKPVSRLNKVAVLLSIGGCCLALNVFNTPLAELSVSGILFGLLACVAFGSYQLVADLKLPGDLQQLSIITVGLTVGGIVGSIINPSMYIRLPQLSPLALGLFLLSVVMTKIVPLLLEVRAISIIGSERASVILSMEVPWTLLLAYFTLGETMLPSQLAGVGLVVLSVILLQKK